MNILIAAIVLLVLLVVGMAILWAAYLGWVEPMRRDGK